MPRSRALLNWSQDYLVAAPKITKKTIADFERGATNPRRQTLAQLITAFETAGVAFLYRGGSGARLRQGRQ